MTPDTPVRPRRERGTFADAAPINAQRLPASDGPPPKDFQLERPGAGHLDATAWTRVQSKRKRPSGVAMAEQPPRGRVRGFGARGPAKKVIR